MLNIGYNSFLETIEEFKNYACKCNIQPKSLCKAMQEIEVVGAS